MKKLTANFYPAKEEKNGYIGKANITIAEALRINGISVFQNAKDGTINIDFPGFGDGVSYVVPKSKEAYAAMAAVVAMAVEDKEHHFGHSNGDYGLHFDVSGKAVKEPYADCRFSIDVEDICVLHGVTTRPVEFEKDGKQRGFISVDMPTIGTFENSQGEPQYRRAFEGRVSKWTDREGQEQSFDYGQRIAGLVRSERKAILERKPSLDDQLKDAKDRKEPPAAAHDAPAKEQTR